VGLIVLISLANFAGVAPKLAPYMLQPNQSQVAMNTRLWTGALEALPQPTAVKNNVGNAIKTIYRFGQSTPGDTNYWFTWQNDVYVVKGPIAGDTTERTYYTGDGYPKVTNNALALAGSHYPANAYKLGVPAPTTAPLATADGVVPETETVTSDLNMTVVEASKAITKVTRAANTATITVDAAHGFRVGQKVSVAATTNTLFNGEFIITDVPSSTTFSYSLPGSAVALADDTGYATITGFNWGSRPQLNSGSAGLIRTSVSDLYKYYLGRDPSTAELNGWADPVIAADDKVTALMNVDANIAASNEAQINRLFRNLVFRNADSSGLAYWANYIATGAGNLNNLDTALRESSEYKALHTAKDVVVEVNTTVELTVVYETRAYVYTYVTGWGEESMPSDPVTLDVAPEYQTVNITGMAPPPSGNYNITTKRIYRTSVGTSGTNYYFVAEIPAATPMFHDDILPENLGEILLSLTWTVPPETLTGLVAMPNGFLAGFTGQDICFSEAYYLHAWPDEYKQSVDYPIVGLSSFGQNLVVLTTGAPYMLTGSDPSSMTLQKLEFEQSCVSAKSICRLGAGVVYASPDGLAYIGPDGMNVLTDNFFTRTEWQTLNPSSILGLQHDGRYYAFYDNGVTRGGFILDPKSNGSPFIFTDQYYDGLYNDLRNDALYGVRQGTISKLEGSTSLLDYTWRSKQFLLPKPINFKCSQVLAVDYTDLTVKYFVDGVLVFTIQPTSQAPFQLPAGYKGRVLEVELSGTSTVVAVHVAESMEELRNV
jgi:Domain of unknown function (DUF4214)